MAEVLGTEFIPHSLFTCATRSGVGRGVKLSLRGKEGSGESGCLILDRV